MSGNYRWYNLPNGRIMAKMDITAGLVYIVNFIKTGKSEYTCFFYPSVNSMNNMAIGNPLKSISDLTIQEKIYVTLQAVLKDFVAKYSPESIVFTTQFYLQLSKINSSTVPGYSSDTTPGKQLILKRNN